MNVIIPLWFYGFDSVMYILSSMVGFVLSFFFYNIHSLTKEKKHNYLYIGFLLLSIGLLSIGVGSAYSYISFKKCAPLCNLGIMDNVFSIEDFSYFIYFAISMIAYLMFILTYKDEKIKKSTNILTAVFIGITIFILGFMFINRNYQFWYSYSQYFHMSALILIGFVVFRTMINYYDKRSTSMLLVMLSFIFIFLFHLLYLFSFVAAWPYALSHFSLLFGFFTLLVMLLKANKNE
jgi:hypothetical protein